MENDIYFKQKKLFNPHESNLKCHIYGVGSIGSHVTIGLAKIGVTDITVYDFDDVEESNIPAQMFRNSCHELYTLSDIGVKKTNAIHNVCKTFCKTFIQTFDIKITKDFMPDLSTGSIHIIAFDNIESRKILYDKLKGFPVYLIDGRIGGFNYEKYFLDCSKNTSAYEKTLEGVFSELECGEKCLWSVNSLIASKIITDAIKISKNIIPLYLEKGNVMSSIVITKEECV